MVNHCVLLSLLLRFNLCICIFIYIFAELLVVSFIYVYYCHNSVFKFRYMYSFIFFSSLDCWFVLSCVWLVCIGTGCFAIIIKNEKRGVFIVCHIKVTIKRLFPIHSPVYQLPPQRERSTEWSVRVWVGSENYCNMSHSTNEFLYFLSTLKRINPKCQLRKFENKRVNGKMCR